MNNIIHKEYVPYTTKVEVTEKRAPTDDSIRLYKELQEKAENSVVLRESFYDNELNGTVVMTEVGMPFDKLRAHILFSLNGKKYHEIVEVERTITLDKQEVAKLLYMAIIQKLSEVFTYEFYKI